MPGESTRVHYFSHQQWLRNASTASCVFPWDLAAFLLHRELLPFVEPCETSIQRLRQFLCLYPVGVGQCTLTACYRGADLATDLRSIV